MARWISPCSVQQPDAVHDVHCGPMPHCLSEQIVKRGKTRRGKQRYLCQNIACTQGSFLLDYSNRGCLPEVKQQIIELLEPFGLTRFYIDHWGAYTRHLDPEVHCPDKRHTQKIERKHL